jgi:hypothetical protein
MAGYFDRPVDRALARMIAYKRLATGTSALVAGVALFAIATAKGHGMSPLLALGLAIFFGGGAWTLRDGVRLHRELRR